MFLTGKPLVITSRKLCATMLHAALRTMLTLCDMLQIDPMIKLYLVAFVPNQSVKQLFTFACSSLQRNSNEKIYGYRNKSRYLPSLFIQLNTDSLSVMSKS